MIRKILAITVLAVLVSACGARSFGNKIDDQFIGPEVTRAIKNAHIDLSTTTSRIIVTSYNGVVLVTGQTPRAELKELAGKAAQSVQSAKKIHNELQVTTPTSGMVRSNDGLLTANIKTRMLSYNDVPASKVKVITENGVVYLLGIISRAEANRATAVVQEVSGVQKIVRLFEYLD
ncbi:BON domain-containing protein [Pseudomonas sp. C27(2019)]|uniref:BON domain-containing protein n=1 Tax=Pseudomonas sp. C27(2019) TaxID=2604941 RepID=UPI0012469E62|nr:BON domain-containing protein [Pseudomonas sp. C27(2019)]QEY59657.1 BON domain-containing protein [Pseudomonas sp. C27(2019)]